mmetsp:Transcript_81349/g.235905  ORF Transcript_81349/g.235905 Transcript_81349/m.235905 type:complete len:412 (+) Transcript_81349:3885-5120(+)
MDLICFGGPIVLLIRSVRLCADERVQHPKHCAFLEIFAHALPRNLLLLARLRQRHEKRQNQQALAIHDAALRNCEQCGNDVLRALDPVEMHCHHLRLGRRRRLPCSDTGGVLNELLRCIRGHRCAALEEALVVLLRSADGCLADLGPPGTEGACAVLLEHPARERQLRPDSLSDAAGDAALDQLRKPLQALALLRLDPCQPPLGQSQTRLLGIDALLELLPRLRLAQLQALDVGDRVHQLLCVTTDELFRRFRIPPLAVPILDEVRVVVQVVALDAIDWLLQPLRTYTGPQLLQKHRADRELLLLRPVCHHLDALRRQPPSHDVDLARSVRDDVPLRREADQGQPEVSEGLVLVREELPRRDWQLHATDLRREADAGRADVELDHQIRVLVRIDEACLEGPAPALPQLLHR